MQHPLKYTNVWCKTSLNIQLYAISAQICNLCCTICDINMMLSQSKHHETDTYTILLRIVALLKNNRIFIFIRILCLVISNISTN